MSINKREFIISRIKATLGEPIIGSDIDDYKSMIDTACLRFFTARPLLRRYGVSVGYGETVVDVDAMMNLHYGDNAYKYYFLGVVRSDFTVTGDEYLGSSRTVDSFLAGANGIMVGRSRGCGMNVMVTDVLRNIVERTQTDILTAEEEYLYDPISRKITILTSELGSVNFEAAYGYVGDPSNEDDTPLSGVAETHLGLVADLVLEEVLETIVAGRGSVSLTSDFSLEVGPLADRLGRLRDRNQEQLSLVALPVLSLG